MLNLTDDRCELYIESLQLSGSGSNFEEAVLDLMATAIYLKDEYENTPKEKFGDSAKEFLRQLQTLNCDSILEKRIKHLKAGLERVIEYHKELKESDDPYDKGYARGMKVLAGVALSYLVFDPKESVVMIDSGKREK